MNIQNLKLASWRRTLGLLVMIIGALVLFAPIFVGGWVIALLGVALIAAGLFQFAQLLRPQEKHKSISAYVAGTVTILLGVVLFLSPDLAMSGLLLGVTGFFLIDGGTKFYEAYKESAARRWWALFNGLCLIIIGLALWSFLSGSLEWLWVCVC
jgi:uncharacterized membrane protein HdeD (DUF308 family)